MGRKNDKSEDIRDTHPKTNNGRKTLLSNTKSRGIKTRRRIRMTNKKIIEGPATISDRSSLLASGKLVNGKKRTSTIQNNSRICKFLLLFIINV
jgi:hypothetical protein